MEFNYFDVGYAVTIHDLILEISGGRAGVHDLGLIESTLGLVQNDDYYTTLEDKVSYILFSIAKNHAFVDGNKRSAIALGATFLAINLKDSSQIIDRFIKELENVIVYLADNKISRALLNRIVFSLINETELAEDILLEIIKATE